MHVAGIVLCGGRSQRMGQPKAWLPIGDETFLARIVRQLQDIVAPVVVVAAADQTLPELPHGTLVVRDRRPSWGPLEGLRVGLEAVGGGKF